MNQSIDNRSTVRILRIQGFRIAMLGWLLLGGLVVSAEDSVEFLNGTTLSGKVLEIRKPQKEFDFESSIAGQTVSRTYSYSAIHAVTFGGKRFVINPMKSASSDTSDVSNGETVQRSRNEVKQLIAELGASDPDWLDSTSLNHPKSLDLSWPMKAEGPWNESKNVGQYMWGRVNPNPSRWRSGVKLIYECMDLHQGNRELLKRDASALASKYFELFQDYPRAAYWYEKADAKVNQPTGVHLAECYYRLGNKAMAMAMLRGQSLHVDAIKLLGEMGELDQALKVADRFAKTRAFNEAFLNAGDALRSAGKHEEALRYYQQILDRNEARNAEYLQRFRGRASDSIEAIRLFEQADVSKVADGVYRDHARGYNGDLHVQVTVASGRIESVEVTQHKEKQFYAALTDTPKQIIDTQGVREIDGTSGATITSQAIVNATARALAQGAK
ncbi:FMN-binding protein [Rhodopirellula halodulae]|uniref:FMN-binding protein n=1 Tax=Rhodopirellula halodulae TaxID=2894198 RepID=UPI001E2D46AC|nr:FMN-binding protein [Rhodopirellula sp. JC737]MCC9655022.1 FMN-binding protein [Rhodopirellula sp. JC737]